MDEPAGLVRIAPRAGDGLAADRTAGAGVGGGVAAESRRSSSYAAIGGGNTPSAPSPASRGGGRLKGKPYIGWVEEAVN